MANYDNVVSKGVRSFKDNGDTCDITVSFDESGLLFDGQPIKADGDSKVIDELKKEVDKLENNLNDLAKVVGGEADGEIKDLLEDVK